jgi:hypothetical protein
MTCRAECDLLDDINLKGSVGPPNTEPKLCAVSIFSSRARPVVGLGTAIAASKPVATGPCSGGPATSPWALRWRSEASS